MGEAKRRGERPRMAKLYHLTMNSGHVAQTPRENVRQDVIDRLLPMIDAEEGEFPEFGLAFDVMRPTAEQGGYRDGAAYFQVADTTGMSKTPFVMCIGCWRAEMSSEAWEQALALYEKMRPSLQATRTWKPAPEQPPRLPWLAVILTPFMVALKPEQLIALGDLERCLFWAMAEGN